MRTKIRMAFITVATAGLAVTAVAPALADPGSPTDATYGPGDLTRAELFAHENFAGPRLTMKGTSNCTTAPTDIDTRWSDMRDHGWSDEVSAARDYHACDIKLFADINFGGASPGPKHYGGGASVPNGWNDRASSFQLT